MRSDLPSRFQTKVFVGNATVTTHDVGLYGLLVAATAGITLILPTPGRELDGVECMIVNNSSDSVTIACSNGFPNSADNLTLPAGAAIYLYCAQLSGTAYRWATVGATAS